MISQIEEFGAKLQAKSLCNGELFEERNRDDGTPESGPLTSLATPTGAPRRPGLLCPDKAFALIEGYPFLIIFCWQGSR